MANGETIKSSGKGMCKIVMVNSSGQKRTIVVKDVLFIKILKHGFRVVFQETVCSIQDSCGEEVAVADNKYDLFMLREVRQEQAMVAECKMQKCQHYWHRIFGHRNINSVREMQKGKTVSDFYIIDC